MRPPRSTTYDTPLAPPHDVLVMAKSVLGGIDFDPFSTPIANRAVTAARFLDRSVLEMDDIIASEWDTASHKRMFLAVAPGIGVSNARRLLNKTLIEYQAGRVNQAVIWVAVHESMIACPWIWDHPVCIPFRRLRPRFWDDEIEGFRNASPSAWSFVFFLPPAGNARRTHRAITNFHTLFSGLGRIVFNQHSGEDDWIDGFRLCTNKPYNFRV